MSSAPQVGPAHRTKRAGGDLRMTPSSIQAQRANDITGLLGPVSLLGPIVYTIA